MFKFIKEYREAKRAKKKEEFLRMLKYGKPQPKRNTRPPFRLAPRVPRQFDGGGLDD